jgi:Trk-type K+ transport system membrane component
MGKKMDLKSRNLVHEAMNLDSGNGVVRFLKEVFITTVVIELIGAILSFAAFLRYLRKPAELEGRLDETGVQEKDVCAAEI